MSCEKPPLEISVQEVKQRMDSGEDILLLDVRELEEHQLARIDGAKLVPLSELQAHLPELQWHTERTIVVHCHHGVRSLQAAAWLRTQGFPVVRSMTGGIEEWSLKVDPQVPRY